MTPDDFGRLASRSLFLSLEHIAAPRLLKVFYVLGLASIALWAISHFFFAFAFGFAEGIWGVIEIVVFGLFMIFGLRIICEAGIVYFKAHEPALAPKNARPVVHPNLMDDVRGAIEDLAGDDEEPAPSTYRAASVKTDTTARQAAPLKGAPTASARPAAEARPAKSGPASKSGATPRKATRRTAKRTPPATKTPENKPS